jgi:hypothetical protein
MIFELNTILLNCIIGKIELNVLGIQFYLGLKWFQQVAKIVKKADKALNAIK